MATTKNLKTAVPAAQRAKTPSPKEKLKVKTPATIKSDDWYEAAFKRFSISQNRIDTRRDLLASLRPPAKPELQ